MDSRSIPSNRPVQHEMLPGAKRAPPDRQPRLVGAKLGPYHLESHLGGSRADVYLAAHELTGTKRVVKILNAGDAEASRWLVHEAKALAGLQHEHVVAFVDAAVDSEQQRAYLVTEYLPGIDLEAYVRQHGPLPVEKACGYVRQAALGLEYAHRNGVIHRDVKPANLLLAPGERVKLLDLGLARLLAQADETRGLVGTLDYMAPEQARDPAEADARSDLYGLGCTFYQLLTGRPPFEDRGGAVSKLKAHGQVAPTPVRELRPEVPPEVAAIVEKLLAKDPAQRYTSAGEVVRALDAVSATGTKQGAKPLVIAAIITAAVAAAVIAAIVVLASAGPPSDEQDATARGPDPGGAPAGANDDAAERATAGRSAPAPQEALAGWINVRVLNAEEPERDGRLLEQFRVLPVRDGDHVLIEAELEPAAYAYVVWIDSRGRASPVHPWEPGDWSDRAGEHPVRRLALGPPEGWPMRGPPGMETVLLLARRTPLPTDVDLESLLADYPALPGEARRVVAGSPSAVWFEYAEGERVRGPDFSAGSADDGPRALAEAMRLLEQRLVERFSLIAGVCFANACESDE